MSEEAATSTPRTLVIPLVAVERHRDVVNSIRKVRFAARDVYAALFAAQAAGATLEDAEDGPKVTPHNDRAKTILEAVFDKTGKAPVYAARQYVLDHLLPTCRSFVWDELRSRVWERWTAKDPEFPRAGRGWLSLQNVRGLAVFRNLGIGFPAATGKPVFAAHSLTLHWDREIGPVEFRVGDLDPGRWSVWRRVASGEYRHGTLQLSERDGKLRAIVSYYAPTRCADLDPGRRIDVTIIGDTMHLRGPDGATTLDAISLVEARDWCARLKKQQGRWEARRGAAGSPNKPWGQPRKFRAIAEHQHRLTRCRTAGAAGRNHAWSKRIATRAGDWRCGVVSVALPADGLLCGHPWQWAQFLACCRYKLAAIGATLVDAGAENAPAPALPKPAE